MHKYLYFVIPIGVVAVGLFVWWHLRRVRRRKAEEAVVEDVQA
jgi:hypothetical protein